MSTLIPGITGVLDQWHHLSNTQQCILVSVAVVGASLGRILLSWKLSSSKVPMIGESIFSSYLNPAKVAQSWNSFIKQGYEKYRGHGDLFKIVDPNGWNIIVCDPKITTELMKLPDDTLSVMDAIEQSLQVKYTLGPTLHSDPYHIHLVQNELTRNITALFPSLLDEIVHAFAEEIPQEVNSEGWATFKALPVAMNMASRVANRAFVGTPLCRNKQYLGINVLFAMDVIVTARKLHRTPAFLRPLVARYIGKLDARHKAAHALLGPVIEKRYQVLAEHNNNWDSIENDFLTSLMKTAKGDECKPENLTHRILAVNFAAIHTTSMNFTWILLYLAAYPECAPPLREEIQKVMSEESWSKSALSKCRKLDSVMKEVMRLCSGPTSVSRIALRDIRLSNGVMIKKGTRISVAADAQHHDPTLYGSDADKFDGFRFSKVREAAEKESLKHQVTFCDSEFVAFGAGRHACPGRFFAANEIKALTAYAIMNYDIKYADHSYGNGRVPPRPAMGGTGPDRNVQLMVRKRTSEVSFTGME